MAFKNFLPVLLLCAVSCDVSSDGHHSSHVTLANFGRESDQINLVERRYILYDVNPGEGFNLRRDVYMRVANAVRQLRERGHDFVLVLPPWGNLWHWRRKHSKIKWSELFDLRSLSELVPVIEFEDFMKQMGYSVDLVLYLQQYAEGWSESEGYALKYDVKPCLEADKYYRRDREAWHGHFFSFGGEFHAKDLRCLSIQGQSSTLADALLALFADRRSILVDRSETILHDHFGDFYYWQARKSMQYAKPLRSIADNFRQKVFGGNDFLCAHLRRADFVWSHREEIPTIEGAAKQLIDLMRSTELRNLFLCTDGTDEEVGLIASVLSQKGIHLERYTNDKLSDAAVSIIDQWVCAHARHFIGTHHSTFSLRIHEDREILGFAPETTFNRLCPDNQTECEQPAKWRLIG